MVDGRWYTYYSTPYLLLHEQVQSIIKISPHIRVEMNPTDTLGVRRGGYIVKISKEAGTAVHYNISEDVFIVIRS